MTLPTAPLLIAPLLIAPADLAELYGGQPVLLALDMAFDAGLALPGLSLWQVTSGDGVLRLHRPGEPAAAATQPVPVPPARVLALLAADAAAAGPLLA
ncbi:MAG: hypothetical protein JWP04_3993, partial [Belnapia sp.]|nr:hypothetical protein [Belnapia sp.]